MIKNMKVKITKGLLVILFFCLILSGNISMAADCPECGAATTTQSVQPGCETEGYIKIVCTGATCGKIISEQKIIASGHSAEFEVVAGTEKRATCTTEGTVTMKCKNCDHTETIITPATGHDYKIEETTATCTQKGTTTYTCSKCNHTYTDTNKELGHDYKETARIEAKCEEDGSVEYTCTRCGDKYSEILKATGHNYEDGVCKDCGKKENNEEKPKDDETTSDDKKLPQTGLDDMLAVVTSAVIANAGASFIMLKKKEN